MRTRLAATAVAAAALLSLAACSSGGNDDKAAPSSSATAPTTNAPATTAPTTTTSRPAAPNAAVRAAYLAALKAVDPSLAADPDQTVEVGRTQCAQLESDPETADHVAAQRFSTPGHPLTDAQGKLIDLALHSTICP